MDFTHDDLCEAIDAVVRQALDRGGVAEPPVDALHLAQLGFGLNVEYMPEEDEPRRYGDTPRRRPGPRTILLRETQSEESQHIVAARAIAKLLVPEILTRLGIAEGTENRSAQASLLSLVAPRLLLPTRWFATDARRGDFDLPHLKDRYPTASYDMLAVRFLDVADDPMLVTIVDDGNVSFRRANRFATTRKLMPVEDECARRIAESEQPLRLRRDDWTVWGWPTRGIPFRRIILRAVPDDV